MSYYWRGAWRPATRLDVVLLEGQGREATPACCVPPRPAATGSRRRKRQGRARVAHRLSVRSLDRLPDRQRRKGQDLRPATAAAKTGLGRNRAEGGGVPGRQDSEPPETQSHETEIAAGTRIAVDSKDGSVLSTET